MRNKIYFIITILLITAPLVGLAETTDSSFDVNTILNELLSGEQATSPNVSVKKFDLSWSADTYVPLEYEGRTLPVRGGKVFVSADVSVSNGDARNLKYSWFLEDIFQKDKSGYGKNSFYFYVRQTAGGYHHVRVQIFNEDRTIFQEKTIDVPVTKPEIVLSRPNDNRTSIIAKPYFFSIEKLTDLEFQWTLEGQEPIISSNYNASILDINVSNKNTNATIEQQFWLSVKNLIETEQSAYNSIKINL